MPISFDFDQSLSVCGLFGIEANQTNERVARATVDKLDDDIEQKINTLFKGRAQRSLTFISSVYNSNGVLALKLNFLYIPVLLEDVTGSEKTSRDNLTKALKHFFKQEHLLSMPKPPKMEEIEEMEYGFNYVAENIQSKPNDYILSFYYALYEVIMGVE